MSETLSRPTGAKPTGAHDAPDSLATAAAAFQAKLFPQGQKRERGEKPPEPQDDVSDDVEPGQDSVEEIEQPEPDAEETVEQDEADEVEPEQTESDSEDEVVEDEAEDTTPPVKSRKLKFSDGTEADVSEDEAYNGYLRTKDYTQKTQAAAEQRKRAEAAEKSWSERAAQLASTLEQQAAAMDRLVPKEPNWSDLRTKLSAEDFASALEDWRNFKSERDKVTEAQTKLAKERAEKLANDYESWRKGEIEKLLSSVPEWVDRTVGEREAGEMAAYALSAGFSKEEVDNAVDHRYLLLIRKAMLWDRAQKSAGKVQPKVAKSGIKTAPPGGKKPAPKPKTDVQRAKESLRQSGSLKDAAAVFSHRFDRAKR